MYKVYQHRRPDNNEIFYVGYGKGSRPWQYISGRGKDWKAIYNQFGCITEVIAKYDEEELAQAHEVISIAMCREQGLPIVNKRNGGKDKTQGIPHSLEAKHKISQARFINNGNAKQVKTPAGLYKSAREAARNLNMSIDQMYYRIANKPGYEYI